MSCKIHATGDWPRGAVMTRRVESSRPIIPEVEAAIERSWSESLATRPHVQLLDGLMCRLESFEASESRFELSISLTSYKPFFGTNMCSPQLADRFGPNVLANPIGLSAALMTSDDRLVFGRRNASVAYYPNRIHPFAGTLEPSANAKDEIDVFDGILRELHEEISLPREEIFDLRCIGLVEDDALRQPELVFIARTSQDLRQIESTLDFAEHTAVWSIAQEAAEIRRALGDSTAFTPVAIATMQLLVERRT